MKLIDKNITFLKFRQIFFLFLLVVVKLCFNMIKKLLKNTGVQFISLISLLILSAVFIIFYIGTKVNNLSDINKFHEELNQFIMISVQLKEDLNTFKTEKHVDEFFELNTDESVKNVFNTRALLFSMNNNLIKYSDAERYEVLPHFQLNEALLNEYSDKFALLIKNKIEIGNTQYGYVQKLNNNESQIEDNIYDQEELYSTFNYINSLKTQYFQSLSLESADQLIIHQLDFIEEVKQSYFENDDNVSKNVLQNILAEYLNNFEQIFMLHQIGGTRYYGGLYNELNMLSEEMIINVSDAVQISKIHIRQDYNRFRYSLILFIGLSSVIILLILFLLYRILKKGFIDIRKRTSKLVFENSELSFFKTSGFFKSIVNMLRTHESDLGIKKEIIENLASEKIDKTYNFNEKDLLGQSILNLQKNMFDKKNNALLKDEKRVIEDKHKEGIAKFGRILRRHVGDIDSLSYELISELVNFIDAEIGGIYVADIQEEKRILHLRASHAYDERKLMQKEIEFGEGLIGTCAVDKTTFFIDKVDDNYIKVVSGFGHTKPTSIVISPILVDEDVYGVIELAATRLFNADDIKFIEILAEDIAYTLSYLLSLEK